MTSRIREFKRADNLAELTLRRFESLQTLRKTAYAERRDIHRAGPLWTEHAHTSNNAQRPLSTDEKLLQIIACIVLP